MMEFWEIVVFASCLYLPVLTASPVHENFCSKNSFVDIERKPEGSITFPLTTRNYTDERCKAEIRAAWDSEIVLTLVNLRRIKQLDENCYDNYVEIFTYEVHHNYSSYKFCKSVGSAETIKLKSTIRMIYKASILNDIEAKNPETAVSIQYKRIILTKACNERHIVLKPGESGTFQTYGYPKYPLRGDCEWVITTAAGEGISIEFQILNANLLNCHDNFIDVRQGESSNASAWVRICNRSRKRIQSSASKLWIRVKSSSIGVLATFTSQTCQVVVSDEQLDFQSPKKTFCQTWNLTSPLGQIAALSFSHVNVASTDSTQCLGNFLEVWDGKTTTKYCNSKLPPQIIVSKGQKLVVTYRSTDFDDPGIIFPLNSFRASFTSIQPSSFKTNCYVQNTELSFKCNDNQIVPCEWYCDGAMQCSDNSDENTCSTMQAQWQKLQLFVIVMGSICASTVMFCIGLLCFRKCILNERSSSRRRRYSVTDQSSLAQNADLPSPPPGYFTNRDEVTPAAVVHGTYFFGDEFSQSSIHNASLFGIPPPRYCSTESLHQTNSEARSIWQRGMSSISLVPEDGTQTESREGGPPDYDSLCADKDEQIMTNESQDNHVSFELGTQQSEVVNTANFSIELIPDNLETEVSFELQTHIPSRTSLSTNDTLEDSVVDIGVTNEGASLDV